MDQTLTNELGINDYETTIVVANHYASVEDYENAEMYYESAANLNPDAAEPYLGMGNIALTQNIFERASLSFRVAKRLDPKSCESYNGLAAIAQAKKDYETAFELYLKSLELNPDNLKALLGLFQTSCQMGTFANVMYYLHVYLDTHPDDTSVMFTLAALYMKDDCLDKSVEILNRIMELQPDNTEAANLLEEVQRKPI